MATDAVVALGSNLVLADSGASSSADMLRLAFAALARLPGVVKMQQSSIWTTVPVAADGGPFANAVALLEFDPSPQLAEDLLETLLTIELSFGRDRSQRPPPLGHSPARTLDLDLIWFAGQMANSDRLVLPHPRALEREFVLGPLAELAPSLRLLAGGPTVAEALQQLRRSH